MTTASSVRIRPATPLDAEALAAVHARCWRETYAGLVPEEVFDARERTGVERWQRGLSDPDRAPTWVAIRGDDVLGFSGAVAVGPGQVRSLELTMLYLLAAEHGTGAGQALLDVAVGDAPCFCWVAEGNARALAFYRRNGLLPDGARETVERWGGLPVVRLVR